MKKLIEVTKLEILEKFSKTIPNAEKMLIDYGRDSLLIQFDGIHSKEYKISEIVTQLIDAAKKKGYEVNIKC